ncbi:MAG: 50S ribosome-binding GTPase [Candidatus Eisenbacteria bacterium]|nr:50S ribosome-binding GTPase [Candidatus Eisenbacteria bacterium]
MPANLPPQYHEVERKFREAKEPAEKLAFLREMFAVLPKHKGTDKLQADLKRRISKLQDSLQKSHKVGRRPYAFSVEREGAAQIVLLGVPNSGKSSILRALTHAEPEVAAYPFTTRKPTPGMMPFEDIQIQLVDMPPIVEEGVEHWFPQLVRSADAALIVADVTSPTLFEDIELIHSEMGRYGISLVGRLPGKSQESASAERASEHAPTTVDAPPEARSASSQEPTGEVAASEAKAVRKALVVANKVDVTVQSETLTLVKEYLGQSMKVVPFSALTGEGTGTLGSQVFEMLALVRVYTKVPGKKPDLNRPFVLPGGSTILDVARLVHKDFAANLRFAKTWGAGVFDGQFVERDHVVSDKDVVELHL